MPSPMPFKKISALAALLLCLITIQGCQHAAQGNPTANYPIGEQFPQIYQKNLQASAHWRLIAHNEAQLLVDRFDEVPALQLSAPQQPGQSTFTNAYHDFLAEGLLNEGALVYESGQDFRVDYDIEVVEFSGRSQLNLPPGFFSASALSVYIIAHALETWSNPVALLVPAAIGADFYSFMNADSDTPDTEIILTTRVRGESRLLYSHSSIYYLRTSDVGLYGGSKSITVRGPTAL